MADHQDPLGLISGDRPLDYPEDDRLGYAPFARHLAKALTETLSLEGLVLGLYGDWGSGKSTLINFLIKELEKIDEKKRPILVRFNPWWYSGSSNLTSRFLLEFLYGLSGGTRVSDKVRDAIAGLADVLGDVGVGGVKIQVGKMVAGYVKPNRSAEGMREKVVRGLEELNRRILVIVDDVDRLHQDEILQLFLAIKAIGNFPRTNYILAMDKRVVVDALGEAGFGNGEEFLEKIVQVPLDLPDVDRHDLENLLVEKLDKVFADLPQEKFDTERWNWLFIQGIRPILRTPRQVIRLMNCLSMIYPVVVGEVNAVDLIGIEALRLFFDPAYQAIRRHPERFLSGHVPAWNYPDSERQAEKNFHEGWLRDLPEAKKVPACRMVSSLFPTTAAALSSFSPYSVEASVARRELRICARERFPVYFRLWVPAEELRASEVIELLDAAREGRRFAAKLLQLSRESNPDGTSRARTALDRFADLCEGPLSDDVVVGGLEGLFEVGDQLVLLRDRKTQLFDIENDYRVTRCISLLGGKVGRDRYGNFLESRIARVESLTVPLSEICALAREHGRLGAERAVPEAERRAKIEDIEVLEKIAKSRIEREASEGTLLRRPKLFFLLYLWKQWGGEREARGWLERLLQDIHNLPALLLGLSVIRSIHTSGSARTRLEYSVLLEDLAQWVAPASLVAQAKELLETGRQEGENQAVLEAFLRQVGNDNQK